ncbi:hypothetical protein MMPV_001353 [Pyropia vietnamensis]
MHTRRTRSGSRAASSQLPMEAATPQRNPPARTSQDGDGSSRHSGDLPPAGAGPLPNEDLAQLRQALMDERVRNQDLVRQLEDHRRAVEQVDKIEVKTVGMDTALPPKEEVGTSRAHAAWDDASRAEFKKELQLQVRSILKEMRSRRERLSRGDSGRKKVRRGSSPSPSMSSSSSSSSSSSFSSSYSHPSTVVSRPTSDSEAPSVPPSESESSDKDGPDGPPSPPSSGGSSPRTSHGSSESRGRHRRRGRRPRSPSVASAVEEYDRRKVIRVTNRRFKRLLNYRTYFLADRRLEYTRRQVAKASKVSKGLDGPFAGQAPFTGEDPLAVFTFLSTFKRACDAAGVRHGQAITLLGFRLAGAAKRSFASATSTLAARSRYAIRTYGDAVNWLLQRYATPDLLNAAYQDVLMSTQEPTESPRDFSGRVEQKCDRLSGLFREQDIVDIFVNGLHGSIKAHVLALSSHVSGRSLPDTVTTAQIFWDGYLRFKSDVARQQRNMTRMAAAVTDAPPEAPVALLGDTR